MFCPAGQKRQMTNRNIILTELNDLGSTLANSSLQNTYTIPEGYFEELANQVLSRIKALETPDAVEELQLLSPLLTQINRETPYTVPVGYFDGLEEKLMQRIREHADYQTSGEELASLSPMLSSISKKIPYTLPAGYFESLVNNGMMKKEDKKEAVRVISITRQKWFRFAAAAVLVAFIAISGWIILFSKKVDPVKNPEAWVVKNTKKISSEEINSFINLADEEQIEKNSADNKSANEEIRELMKDVPDNEIQTFLNETAALEDKDEVLLN